MSTIRTILKTVTPQTYTQLAAYHLLNANGSWLKATDLNRVINSAGSRIRDLRKKAYGNFKIEVATAPELHRQGDSNTYFYRINPARVTTKQISRVFGI